MLVGCAQGASEVDEFILIEMEQALMRVYNATHKKQLLASLNGLIKYHSARHYTATLPIMERYIDIMCPQKCAALLHYRAK